MVRIVDELERDGLAERRAVTHDRRTQAISITDRGREQLEAAEGVASDLGERLLARFGEADRQQLHRMLRELIAAAIAARGPQGIVRPY